MNIDTKRLTELAQLLPSYIDVSWNDIPADKAEAYGIMAARTQEIFKKSDNSAAILMTHLLVENYMLNLYNSAKANLVSSHK